MLILDVLQTSRVTSYAKPARGKPSGQKTLDSKPKGHTIRGWSGLV